MIIQDEVPASDPFQFRTQRSHPTDQRVSVEARGSLVVRRIIRRQQKFEIRLFHGPHRHHVFAPGAENSRDQSGASRVLKPDRHRQAGGEIEN